MAEESLSFYGKVREDLILLGVEGDSRDEVLKNMTDVLYEKGVVKDTYYAALLQRENEYPTGLPIGKYNLAIPHTYPEHINELAVMIAVPKKPVIFGTMGEPDEKLVVSVIVCLALKKMDDNIKMLPSLMSFFANDETLEKIIGAKTPSEIMDLLRAANA